MKSHFNKNWVASVQPRKQRKFLHNAPNHIRRKLMASPLDKTLKTKYNRNSIEVIKGDEVKIMRGKNKGKQGKVTIVDVKNCRIQVDGINKSKKTGDKVGVWFHPSKIKIITLNDKDARRIKTRKI
ncbi:MAG: 50S ribosomal protein L24, partial [Nanoarchaeota archaeon]|nr:50S ribosomal protein L24 [Nanoarchaeota archaeon]